MRKVLIAEELKAMCLEKESFRDRSDIHVFTAADNDELLRVHRKEKIDVIVTQLDLSGISTEELCQIIRNSDDLRDVSIIIVCKDTLAHRERCKPCNANAIFTLPVDITLLHMKMQQFLNVAPRKSYRASIAVAIEGKFKDKPQPFWTENISASGMLIRTKEPLTIGAGTFFSFFLPNGTHISGYGEIARIVQQPSDPETFLYGIKFTDIDPSDKIAIETVVSKL